MIDTRVDADGAPVIAVAGELDISNADALDSAVAAAVAPGPARLTFDLKDLRFMDSAGIAVLIRAAEGVGEVHLLAPAPSVRRVIEITGLTQLFTIEP
jgi:anti-sigma B factor antagonist